MRPARRLWMPLEHLKGGTISLSESRRRPTGRRNCEGPQLFVELEDSQSGFLKTPKLVVYQKNGDVLPSECNTRRRKLRTFFAELNGPRHALRELTGAQPAGSDEAEDEMEDGWVVGWVDDERKTKLQLFFSRSFRKRPPCSLDLWAKRAK